MVGDSIQLRQWQRAAAPHCVESRYDACRMHADSPAPADLERLYRVRFDDTAEFRNRTWKVLTADLFQRFVRQTDAVLDLGCGYGEFINNIECGAKYAIDLNSASADRLDDRVTFFQQD